MSEPLFVLATDCGPDYVEGDPPSALQIEAEGVVQYLIHCMRQVTFGEEVDLNLLRTTHSMLKLTEMQRAEKGGPLISEGDRDWLLAAVAEVRAEILKWARFGKVDEQLDSSLDAIVGLIVVAAETPERLADRTTKNPDFLSDLVDTVKCFRDLLRLTLRTSRRKERTSARHEREKRELEERHPAERAAVTSWLEPVAA